MSGEWLPAVVSRGSSAARSEVTFSSKLRLEADTATEGGGQNLGHQWAWHTAQIIIYLQLDVGILIFITDLIEEYLN